MIDLSVVPADTGQLSVGDHGATGVDGLVFKAVVEAFGPELVADSAVFHTAEWCANIEVVIVDPGRSGANTASNVDATPLFGGPHGYVTVAQGVTEETGAAG